MFSYHYWSHILYVNIVIVSRHSLFMMLPLNYMCSLLCSLHFLYIFFHTVPYYFLLFLFKKALSQNEGYSTVLVSNGRMHQCVMSSVFTLLNSLYALQARGDVYSCDVTCPFMFSFLSLVECIHRSLSCFFTTRINDTPHSTYEQSAHLLTFFHSPWLSKSDIKLH